MYSKMNDISKKPKLIGRSYENWAKAGHQRGAGQSSRGFQRSSIRYADVEISRYWRIKRKLVQVHDLPEVPSVNPTVLSVFANIEQEPSEVKVSRSDLKTRLGCKRLDLSLSNTSTCLFDFSGCLYR